MKLSANAIYFLAIVSTRSLFAQAVPISSVPGLAATLTPSACTGKTNLLCAVPNLFGPYGLTFPNPGVSPIYSLGLASGLVAASAVQFTTPALANPASGFVYQYDPQTGLYARTSQSLGPVMTERGETIGRHKFAFGTVAERLRFQTLDGANLHNLPGIAVLVPGTVPAGDPYLANQLVTSRTSVDIKVNTLTAFATFGLTNRIDVSVAIPFAQLSYDLNSVVTVTRIPGTQPILIPSASGTPTVICCSNGGPGPYGPVYASYFDPKNPATSVVHEFSNNQSTSQGDLYWNPSKNTAAGISDITVRVKGNVYHNDKVSFALLMDVRAPTGDAANFLGSGAVGLRPVAALSVRAGWLTPHVNLGYQWNGNSILAGNPFVNGSARLPGFAIFSAGSDIPLSKYAALSIDYLGQEYVNSPRFGLQTFAGPTGPVQALFPEGNHVYNQSGGSAGLKVSAFNRLLITGNVVMSLTTAGLRQRISPLLGVSYVF